MYCMCFGLWPFNLSFLSFSFLSGWEFYGPSYLKCWNLCAGPAASSFPQCPCSSRSSVSNSSSCCLCIWFRGEPVSSYFLWLVVSHWCKWCMLPCSQRALILVLEHVGNFGVRLPPGCSRHGVSVHCSCDDDELMLNVLRCQLTY